VTDGDRLRLRASVKLGEGLKLQLYKDPLGYLTIGYGRLLEPEKGGGISRDEAEYLLANDLKRCERQCEAIEPYLDLSPARQAVLVELCFNVGAGGLKGFKATLAALKAQAYPEAAAQLLQSKWRIQVGDRAVRLATQLETGVWS
jgi:lysozyme